MESEERNPLIKPLLFYVVLLAVVAALPTLGKQFYMASVFGAHMLYMAIIFVIWLFYKEEGKQFYWGKRHHMALGMIMGFSLISVPFVSSVFAEWVFVEGLVSNVAIVLGLLLLLQILVAIGEEISFRGYIYRNLRHTIGHRYAMLSSSMMFALIHLPSMLFFLRIKSVSGGIMLITLTMTSVLLTLLYVQYGLAASIGFHLTWNFFQYHVYSLQQPDMPGILNLIHVESNPTLITGGIYGPEAGLMGLALICIGILFLNLAEKVVNRAPELECG